MPIDIHITMPIMVLTMTFEQLIKHFGTQDKAAKALGLKQPSINAWRDGIPYPRQCQIQLVTGGILQADKQKQAA